jgi:hypothetical protein
LRVFRCSGEEAGVERRSEDAAFVCLPFELPRELYSRISHAPPRIDQRDLRASAELRIAKVAGRRDEGAQRVTSSVRISIQGI